MKDICKLYDLAMITLGPKQLSQCASNEAGWNVSCEDSHAVSMMSTRTFRLSHRYGQLFT